LSFVTKISSEERRMTRLSGGEEIWMICLLRGHLYRPH